MNEEEVKKPIKLDVNTLADNIVIDRASNIDKAIENINNNIERIDSQENTCEEASRVLVDTYLDTNPKDLGVIKNTDTDIVVKKVKI